jgi:hypothetical protein
MQELAPLELVQGWEERSVAVPDSLDHVGENSRQHGRSGRRSCLRRQLVIRAARTSCTVVGMSRQRAVGLLSCGSSEFFEEEGVSLAPADDPLGRVVRLAEDCCDDLFAGLPRQRPEGDLGYVRLAEPWGVVTRAVGRQQENRDGRQLVHQLGQELL